jgi:HPt (histidine-containing phosphotransfer) domain-containing protein
MSNNTIKFSEQLEILRKKYFSQLPLKLEEVRTLWKKLSETWDLKTLKTLHFLSHSMAGSGGTFGYAQISVKARELEYLLKSLEECGDEPEMQQYIRLGEMVDKLAAVVFNVREELLSDTSPVLPVVKNQNHEVSRYIYIVDKDRKYS